MNENLNAFRVLLKKGIGARSQAEFAKEADISAEHLNRLLNSEKISRPNRTTLKKIAPHLVGDVSYEDLCTVCGYSAVDDKDRSLSESSRRSTMSIEDRCSAVVDDIKTGFDTIIGWKKFWSSLSDMMDVFIMLFSGESSFSFSIGRANSLPNLENDAELAVPVTFCWEDKNFIAHVSIALYCLETKAGKISVRGYSFSPADVARASGTPQEEISDFGCSPGYVMDVLSKNKEPELDFDERFFASVSSDDCYYNTVCGYGLRFASLPDEVRQFILSHEESFHENSDEDFAIELIRDTNNSNGKIFEKCKAAFGLESGSNVFLFIVSMIMRRETGIPFRYYNSEDFLPEAFHDILVLDEDVIANQKAMCDIVGKYTKELGLNEFGWYYHMGKHLKIKKQKYYI